jgi:CspA family cold shock protein
MDGAITRRLSVLSHRWRNNDSIALALRRDSNSGSPRRQRIILERRPCVTSLALSSASRVLTGGIAMRTGTVKWFNTRKGYGYITPIDGGFDVYVQIDAVERAGLIDLKEGQKVDYEVVVDRRTGETFAETLRPLAGDPEKTGSVGGELGAPPSMLTLARLLARKIAPHLGRI